MGVFLRFRCAPLYVFFSSLPPYLTKTLNESKSCSNCPGLPLSVLSSLPFLPPLLNTTIFALLFPFYLILSTIATPLPPSSGSLPLANGGIEEGAFSLNETEDEGESWWPKRVFVLEAGRMGVRVVSGLRR